jgi:hypothetical protein
MIDRHKIISVGAYSNDDVDAGWKSSWRPSDVEWSSFALPSSVCPCTPRCVVPWRQPHPFFSQTHKALSVFSRKGSGQPNNRYIRTRCLTELSASHDLVFIYHEATNSLFVYTIMTSDSSIAYCLLLQFLSHTVQA